MAKKQWYFFAQADFNKWIKDNNFSKSCLTQKIGLNKLVEEYEVWPVSGGMPTYLKFQADRVTSTHYMACIEKDGKTISL